VNGRGCSKGALRNTTLSPNHGSHCLLQINWWWRRLVWNYGRGWRDEADCRVERSSKFWATNSLQCSRRGTSQSEYL